MTRLPKLTLYHMAPSRSSIVLWMLEEIGEPYELRVLSSDRAEHRNPEFLKLNPMGKVPTLVHDGAVITEAAAICCHLADAFPEAGLAVPLGDPGRGPYLKWLFFAPGALEPAIIDRMLKREPGPRRTMGYGDFETVMDVLAAAVEPGPYLMGDRFTTADILIGSGLRWGMIVGTVPERPELRAYISRLETRPALQRAQARDAEVMGSDPLAKATAL